MNRGTGAIPRMTRKEWAQGSLGAFVLIAAMFAADALGGLAESTPQSPAPSVTGEGRSVQAKPGAAVPPRSAARTHASRSRLTPVRRSGTHLNWHALALCESSDNPHAISPSGRYRGLYQFDLSTWRSVGGSGDPARASRTEQTHRAQLLYADRGRAPWPMCGSRL